jgi:hypothetical protein
LQRALWPTDCVRAYPRALVALEPRVSTASLANTVHDAESAQPAKKEPCGHLGVEVGVEGVGVVVGGGGVVLGVPCSEGAAVVGQNHHAPALSWLHHS